MNSVLRVILFFYSECFFRFLAFNFKFLLLRRLYLSIDKINTSSRTRQWWIQIFINNLVLHGWMIWTPKLIDHLFFIYKIFVWLILSLKFDFDCTVKWLTLWFYTSTSNLVLNCNILKHFCINLWVFLYEILFWLIMCKRLLFKIKSFHLIL